MAILEDGKTRSAEQLLAEPLALNLNPGEPTRKYVYTALIEYIPRQIGRGHKPQLVQDSERNFRISKPPDDWPDLVPYEAPPTDAASDPLIVRLESTSHGAESGGL